MASLKFRKTSIGILLLGCFKYTQRFFLQKIVLIFIVWRHDIEYLKIKIGVDNWSHCLFGLSRENGFIVEWAFVWSNLFIVALWRAIFPKGKGKLWILKGERLAYATSHIQALWFLGKYIGLQIILQLQYYHYIYISLSKPCRSCINRLIFKRAFRGCICCDNKYNMSKHKFISTNREKFTHQKTQ